MEEKTKNNCVVVIPVYRVPTLMEQCSFKQGLSILKNYDIVIVTNRNVDLTKFEKISKQCKKPYTTELFDEKYFKGIKGYNALCLSKEFYQRFSDKYVYMLIYQLDAWVFRDELQKWCDKGYDYVGSPFFVSPDKGIHYTKVFNGVGNGGLSLRKIKYCISVLSIPKWKPFMTFRKIYKIWRTDFEYSSIPLLKKCIGFVNLFPKSLGVRNNLNYLSKKSNEDFIFSDYAAGSHYVNTKLPTELVASSFAFELHPFYLYDKNKKKLPFGCHAFEKYELDTFWSSYIPQNIDLPNIMELKSPFRLMNSFIAKYGDKLLCQYSILNSASITCSEQMPQTGGMAQDDSPYMEIHDHNNKNSFTIYRNEKLCNDLKLTVDEEHALIAHEFGHIVHEMQGYGWLGLNDEVFSDTISAHVVGKEIMLSALEKLKVYRMENPLVDNSFTSLPGLENSNSTKEIDTRIDNMN